jgi:hypothetical protein
MRTKTWFWIPALALLLPLVAAAADVSGKWRAEFKTPDGTARVNTFTLKQSGEKVTGMVAGSQDETAIENGTIKGDDISFSAHRPFGRFTYKGKVSGDQIKFSVNRDGDSFEMTAKRISK